MLSVVTRALLLGLLTTWSSLAMAAEGTGLQGTYFANETLSGTPALTRVDAQVNFAWSGGAPGTGLPVDSFSVRWDGEIVPLRSEALTLIACTDDGVRLWLDGQLVIDAWVLRGAADSTYTFTAVAGQRYRIRMEYYEHFGSAVAQLQWRSATIARTAVPKAQLYPTAPVEPPSGSGTGLLARYYANETLSGVPVLARTDARVDFGWGGGSPGAGVPVDRFSARWDGEIEARVSEPLTIIARTDDGVRVWLDGQVVVDQWVPRSAADSTFVISAEAGQRYRIRIEYFERTGAAVARLYWQSASEPKAPIPTSQLYPTDPIDPPNGTGTGLLASYFANETLSGPVVLERTDARVDFDWAGGSPGTGVPSNSFSARWLGEIEPRTSGPLTLIARTDDGVRMWVNDQLVIDQWVLRGAADSTYTFPAEAGQRYRIRLEYFEHQGSAVAKLWWQSATEPKSPIPTTQLYPVAPPIPPAGTGTGLTASYFANETLSGTPVLSRLDSRVDFNWGSGSPGSPVPADSFSARWEGEIQPRVSGSLTLIARTDDGVRLWLDDVQVINAWILRGAADSTYTFTAEAGRKYRIRMEYFEHFGSAVAKLWWQGTNEPKGPVPTSQLYPTTSTPTTPTIAFSTATSSVNEDVGSTTLTVVLSHSTDQAVTVALQNSGADAQAPTSLTIPAGSTSATVTVTVVDDPRYGPDRQATLALVDPVGADLGAVATHALTLRNTDPKPTLGFVTATSMNLENSGTASVIVRLSAVSAMTTTVTIGLSGSATPGADFTAPEATLQIPADTFEGTIFLPLLADNLAEVDETIILTLSSPVGADLGGITTHTVTVSDVNQTPVIVTGPTPSANPVTGTSVDLSLITSDDGLAADLTTTWSVVGAPAGSITFAPSSSTGFAVSTTATLNGAFGTYTIQATSRDAYNASASAQVTVSFFAPRQAQTITFAAPPAKTYGDAPFTVSATASSGLPVTLISDDPTVATVSGTTVTIVGAGTTVITATQAGNATWEAAPPVSHPLTVAKAAQTITFAALGSRVVGDAPFELTATASSGQPISFASSDTSVATVSGTTVTIHAAGSTTITASQGGSANYLAATPVDQLLTVTKKVQTITFAALADKTYGDAPFTLAATASSGLTVTYTSADPAVATVSGSTVTIVGAGSTTITAAQAGDATWNAATDVAQPLTVAKASQTITFAALGTRTVGEEPFLLTATASSGEPVSYDSSDPAVATVTGGTVTILATGSTTITASQGGTANYLAATPVPQVLTVTKKSQVITFEALAAKTYGDAPFALIGTASSGLPLTFTSADPSVATVSGSTVTIVGAGSTIITAEQPGDTMWDVATPVPQPLTVNKASQTITFAALPSKTVTDAPFNLQATSSSGLPVSFASPDSSVVTISGSLVTIVGPGTATITASQAGDQTYSAALPVSRPLVVSTSSPTDPTEPPVGEWTADFIAQVSITGYETGSENEVVDGDELHYTNSTSPISVTVSASSPSGASVQSIVITVGDQEQMVLGNSGTRSFGLTEGDFRVSVAISGGNSIGSGVIYQEKFGANGKRIVVDRTTPTLTMILPKRLSPTDGDQDFEADRKEYPFIRREEQHFWVNGMTETWNKPLRARYAHPFFGSGDLTAGILAAVEDSAGLDQRHTTDAVQVKVVDRRGTPTGLTASIIDERSSDEDRPVAGESSTKQRLIIRGIAGLGNSWSKNGGSSSDPGDYKLKITMKDKAGNESEEIELLVITVDKLAPDAPKDESDEAIGGNFALGWSGSTTPFRFIAPNADEPVLLVWQTSSTGNTPPTSEPLRKASDAWRLNQTLPGTPESGGDEYNKWFAWTANAQFVFTDVAGNKNTPTSSPLKLICSTTGGPLTYESGPIYHVLVPGVYARDKQKDSIYLYDWIGDLYNQEEEKDQSPTAMELYGVSQLYSIRRDGPGEYTKEERSSRPEIVDGQQPPKYNVEQVSPLDPEQGTASQEVLWVKPAILTIDPSWKEAGGQPATSQQVVVLDKPAALAQMGGSISLSTSTEQVPQNNAQPYSGGSGLTANFSRSRTLLKPGYGILSYAYGSGGGSGGGEGESSSFSSLAAAAFYSEGDPDAVQASLLSFAGGGHYEYSVTSHYWINSIKVSPDIAVSGDRITIVIEAGFFNDLNSPSLFQATGDYVRFCDGNDNITRSVSESQSQSSDPDYFKGKIAILAQRLVFDDQNHWNKQRLELDLLVDPDVEGKLYNIDVRLGSVKGYTSDLDTPNRGTSFGGGVSHRMSEAFNVIRTRFRLLMPDDDGTTILAGDIESVKPIPDIEFNVVSASLQSGDYMTVTIQGRLRDMLSECASDESAAVQQIKVFNGTTEVGQIAVQYGGGSPPWKKRTLPETFTKTLSFSDVVASRGVNIRLEATNGAGNKGVYAVAIPVAPQVTTIAGSGGSGSVVADGTRLTITTDASGAVQTMSYPLPGRIAQLSAVSATEFRSTQFSGITPVKAMTISITGNFAYNPAIINVMTSNVALLDVDDAPLKTSSVTWIETAVGSKTFTPDTSSKAFATELTPDQNWTTLTATLKTGATTLAQASGPGSGAPVTYSGTIAVAIIPQAVSFEFAPSSAVPPTGNIVSGTFSLLDDSGQPVYRYSGDWVWNGTAFKSNASAIASGGGSSPSADASSIPVILPARTIIRGHFDDFRPFMVGYTWNSGIPGEPEFKVGGQTQETEKE